MNICRTVPCLSFLRSCCCCCCRSSSVLLLYFPACLFSFRSIDLQFPFLSIRIHHHFSSLLFLTFSHTPCLSILLLIPALNTTRLVSDISEFETWGLRCGSLCAIYGGVVGVTTARKRCGREVRQKTRVLDRCPQHNTSPS